MYFREQKAKQWAKRQIRKNLNASEPVNCKQFIHGADKAALSALKKIPLLDTVCSKVLSVVDYSKYNVIRMSSMVHITENQLPKIYVMVKSICNKIGIEMPDLYLKMDREVNATTYGTEKFTIVVNSGLLECLEDDELYAVLAHECGHIACNHGLYHFLAGLLLGGSEIGLAEYLGNKGIVGGVINSVMSLVDDALELALFQWSMCSELSADRIAAICCGSANPVIETMMRCAGGTKHIDSEIDRDLFIAQAVNYQQMVNDNKVNKTLEFILTRKQTHPLLAVRAYEVQQFANSKEFLDIIKD